MKEVEEMSEYVPNFSEAPEYGMHRIWPSPAAEMCRGFLLYEFWFCRGFSWRIFLGTFFPQK